jgi:hypothetical protein
MSVRLPESLHQRARELAKEEGISINQLIATALAEKISALDTVSYLEARAARGSRAGFLQALDKIPSGPPLEGDDMPASLLGKK